MTDPTPTPAQSAADGPTVAGLTDEQRDHLRHLVHTCTYDCTTTACSIDEADYDIADAVGDWHAALARAHVTAALTEIEKRIRAEAWFVFDDEDVAPDDEFVRRSVALAIVRNYRQEIQR